MRDLYTELQSNPDLVKRIEGITHEMEALDEELGAAAPFNDRTRELIHELFRVCDYNCGFIIPYFFPEFVESKDPEVATLQPLSLLNRPFAFAMTDVNVGGETTIRASRQISKSTTFCARQLVLTHILPRFRSLYVAPHSEHLRTYANRLRDMERMFRYNRMYTGFRQNLAYKEYPNHSALELVRVHNSAGDARGKSADEILFDEFQNFDVSFLPEVEQTLRASSIPCKIFAGTSLTIDTALETKYQQGSQATWHVRSPDGINWINCGDPEQVVPIIQPAGPTCPFTGQILDMRNGLFVHADQERARLGFPSFHIPQIIIPDFVEDIVQWDKIYQALHTYSQMGQLKKFLQEVLGIPTEEGVREITEDDLKRCCCLPETKQALFERARKGYYKHIVSGIDWGGSDWNPADKTKLSYTFHAMIGITTDNKFDIIHMQRYAGMAYDFILADIANKHSSYKGSHAASDFSAGALYNLMLRERPGIRASTHLILGYGGPDTGMFTRPHASELFNHYHLNRTESITQLFSTLKQDPPRLRCYNWGEAREFISDILNMFRVPTESSSGVTSLKYRRHGSKADDGLHAINFAYTLCRILLQEPLIEDKSLKLELDNRLRGSSLTASRLLGRGGSNVVSG